jgi:hypothetical protein
MEVDSSSDSNAEFSSDEEGHAKKKHKPTKKHGATTPVAVPVAPEDQERLKNIEGNTSQILQKLQDSSPTKVAGQRKRKRGDGRPKLVSKAFVFLFLFLFIY